MIEFFALSNIGNVRKNNEDAYYIPEPAPGNDPKYFMCVADGLGGHNAGEIASQLAIRTLLSSMQTMEGKNRMLNHPFETMQQLFFQANDKIAMLAADSERMQGMGTTLTAAVCTQQMVYIGHVGDSRAYLQTQNGLLQITTDHTFVQTLMQTGQLSPPAALTHPYRHVITRAVGIEKILDIDFYEVKWQPKDRLLLCTDGLTNMLDNQEIAEFLSMDGSLETAALALMALAMKKGGKDNTTLCLAQLQGGES